MEQAKGQKAPALQDASAPWFALAYQVGDGNACAPPRHGHSMKGMGYYSNQPEVWKKKPWLQPPKKRPKPWSVKKKLKAKAAAAATKAAERDPEGKAIRKREAKLEAAIAKLPPEQQEARRALGEQTDHPNQCRMKVVVPALARVVEDGMIRLENGEVVSPMEFAEARKETAMPAPGAPGASGAGAAETVEGGPDGKEARRQMRFALAAVPRDVQDAIDMAILGKQQTDAEIAQRFGLPGPHTVQTRRAYLRKTLTKSQERKEQKRVVVLAERTFSNAENIMQVAMNQTERVYDKDGKTVIREDPAPNLAQANLSIDKMTSLLRLYGEVTGDLQTAGTSRTSVEGGVHQQVMQILSLPRLDDPPEAWQDQGALEAGAVPELCAASASANSGLAVAGEEDEEDPEDRDEDEGAEEED